MNEPNEESREAMTSPKSRRKVWVILFVFAVGLMGVTLYFYNRPLSEAASSKTGDAAAMPGMPMPDQNPKLAAGANSGIGQIYIAPERQQLIGVKSGSAEMQSLTKEIRTVGRVANDETRITHIHTKVSGFIEEVFADYVGKPVKAGDPLFTIYSPDLVATQQDYLLARKSNAVLKDSAFPWVSGTILHIARL